MPNPTVRTAEAPALSMSHSVRERGRERIGLLRNLDISSG